MEKTLTFGSTDFLKPSSDKSRKIPFTRPLLGQALWAISILSLAQAGWITWQHGLDPVSMLFCLVIATIGPVVHALYTKRATALDALYAALLSVKQGHEYHQGVFSRSHDTSDRRLYRAFFLAPAAFLVVSAAGSRAALSLVVVASGMVGTAPPRRTTRLGSTPVPGLGWSHFAALLAHQR